MRERSGSFNGFEDAVVADPFIFNGQKTKIDKLKSIFEPAKRVEI